MPLTSEKKSGLFTTDGYILQFDCHWGRFNALSKIDSSGNTKEIKLLRQETAS